MREWSRRVCREAAKRLRGVLARVGRCVHGGGDQEVCFEASETEAFCLAQELLALRVGEHRGSQVFAYESREALGSASIGRRGRVLAGR